MIIIKYSINLKKNIKKFIYIFIFGLFCFNYKCLWKLKMENIKVIIKINEMFKVSILKYEY